MTACTRSATAPRPPRREPAGLVDLADLLIALNGDPGTGPRVACHLAACLRPAGDGRGDREPAPPADPLDGEPDPARPTARASLAAWLGLALNGDGAPPPADATELSRRLALPCRALERAREVAAGAGRFAAAERRRARQIGAHLLTRLDPAYPPALFDLALPPPVLYVGGELPAPLVAEGLGVAIVGARRADRYGLSAAGHLARALAGAGLCVVSGLARGIDAAAHRGALAAGGTTVGVLGCGLDVDYPRGHAQLRREIAAAGAVVSEFPVGFTPKRWSFPVRNRLIAALTLGTVVVQATERSGSLITAGQALELGREVLAVPGPMFDRHARGPHALLRDGAALAADPRDVLDTLLGPSAADRLLGLGPEDGLAPEDGGEGEGADAGGATAAGEGGRRPGPGEPRGLKGRLLVALARGAGLSAEALADRVGREVDAVLGALLELELEGWARREPGPRFYRTGR